MLRIADKDQTTPRKKRVELKLRNFFHISRFFIQGSFALELHVLTIMMKAERLAKVSSVVCGHAYGQ